MRRRDFIKASALTLATATAIPLMAAEKPWQQMTPEEFTRATIRKREANVRPNYDETHRCPNCGVAYLCPERYISSECGPTAAARIYNWGSCFSMSCSPCSMNVEHYGPAGFRRLWLEAHGVS